MIQAFEFSPWLLSPPRYFFFFRFTTMLISPTIRSSLAHLGRRQMSSTAKVWIDKNTKVICQGFTGKQVCHQRKGTKESLLFVNHHLTSYTSHNSPNSRVPFTQHKPLNMVPTWLAGSLRKKEAKNIWVCPSLTRSKKPSMESNPMLP